MLHSKLRKKRIRGILPVPYHRPPNKNSYLDHLYGALGESFKVRVRPFTRRSLAYPVLFGHLVIHVHWPEAIYNQGTVSRFLRGLFFGSLVMLNRLCGGKLVWTVHNLDFHKPVGKASYPGRDSLLVRFCDGFIFLNRDTPRRFFDRYTICRGRPSKVIPHGLYPVSSEVRKDPEQPTFIMTGAIRAYKGYSEFARLFVSMNDSKVQLRIAGASADVKECAALNEICSGDSRVDLEFRFLPEQEMADLVSSAHLCVLPYKKIENSGVALFALSVGTAVLLPNMPVFRELKDAVGSDWVHLYDEPLTGDFALEALAFAQDIPDGQMPNLSCFKWESIASEHMSFYQQLVESEHGL